MPRFYDSSEGSGSEDESMPRSAKTGIDGSRRTRNRFTKQRRPQQKHFGHSLPKQHRQRSRPKQDSPISSPKHSRTRNASQSKTEQQDDDDSHGFNDIPCDPEECFMIPVDMAAGHAKSLPSLPDGGQCSNAVALIPSSQFTSAFTNPCNIRLDRTASMYNPQDTYSDAQKNNKGSAGSSNKGLSINNADINLQTTTYTVTHNIISDDDEDGKHGEPNSSQKTTSSSTDATDDFHSFISGSTVQFANTKSSRMKSKTAPASQQRFNCDLLVQVGKQRFHHSSDIVAHTSEYIKKTMRLHGTGTNIPYYFVDFSHHDASDWKIVMEFLQPSRPTQLTWQTFPTALPWCVKLKILSRDIDAFLLDTVLTRTQGELTIQNALLWLTIAYRCDLPKCQTHARQRLVMKLLETREQGKLEWDLADLQRLAQHLVLYADLREYVWESSLVVYLPHDLNIEDSLGLVSNPLFPYLLREGMMQLWDNDGQLGIQSKVGRDRAATAKASAAALSSLNGGMHLKLTQSMLETLLNKTVEKLDAFDGQEQAKVKQEERQKAAEIEAQRVQEERNAKSKKEMEEEKRHESTPRQEEAAQKQKQQPRDRRRMARYEVGDEYIYDTYDDGTNDESTVVTDASFSVSEHSELIQRRRRNQYHQNHRHSPKKYQLPRRQQQLDRKFAC